MKSWRVAISRCTRLVLFGGVVIAAVSCADRARLLEPTGDVPPKQLPLKPALSALLIPGARGPVPGRRTLSLSFSDKLTAKDSVWWPDTFPVAMRIKMTVNGLISRNYNPDIWPSLNLAGKPYFNIDADGENLNSNCSSQIITDFKTAPNVNGMNVNGCRIGTYADPNFAPQDGSVEYSTIGIAKGYGYVRRVAFGQPSYPSTQYCGVFPVARCVWANPGSQAITIEPTATFLTLKATPDSILSGDQVLFQPAVPGGLGLSYSVTTWIWVPDDSATSALPPPVALKAPVSSFVSVIAPQRSAGPAVPLPVAPFIGPSEPLSKAQREFVVFGRSRAAAAVLDPRTVYCPTIGTNCQIPIFQSGTMYVRAMVGPVLEQASAHVTVQYPKLVAKCDENIPHSTIRIQEVQCTAELTEDRPFTITLRRAVTADTVIEERNLSVAIAPGGKDSWAGARAVETKVNFKARVDVLGHSLTLTSNEAVFVVTPRTWVEPPMPDVAPIEWISEAVSTAARMSNPRDSPIPGPYPGFGISSMAGIRDSLLPSGSAIYRFGHISYSYNKIGHGPNKDYVYLESMPEVSMGTVRVLTSLQEGSEFFNRQSSATALPGEPDPPAPYATYCDSAAMVAWRTLLYQHEGAAVGPTTSHHSATSAYVLAHPLKAFFEPLVYYLKPDTPIDAELLKRWNNNYTIPQSHAADHTDDNGPVPGVSALPCKLRS